MCYRVVTFWYPLTCCPTGDIHNDTCCFAPRRTRQTSASDVCVEWYRGSSPSLHDCPSRWRAVRVDLSRRRSGTQVAGAADSEQQPAAIHLSRLTQSPLPRQSCNFTSFPADWLDAGLCALPSPGCRQPSSSRLQLALAPQLRWPLLPFPPGRATGSPRLRPGPPPLRRWPLLCLPPATASR